jgi:protein associated with RNAse G/E
MLIMEKDVIKMTDDELYIETRNKTNNPARIKDCIKEKDRRMNEYIQECIRSSKNAGCD